MNSCTVCDLTLGKRDSRDQWNNRMNWTFGDVSFQNHYLPYFLWPGSLTSEDFNFLTKKEKKISNR